MRFSVIIPVWHQWDSLRVCLQGLSDQTHFNEILEIVVVNNDPDDNPPEWVKTIKKLLLLNESKPSSYAARNAGVKAAHGKILAFTDADCIPARDWIEQALAVLREHQDIPRLAGKIELFFRHPEKRSAVELFEQVFAFQQERKVIREGSAITANMFIRSYVFKTVGLFDETLKSWGDTEWGTRAARSGFPILYVPNVRVTHPARYSLRQLYKKTVRLYGGKWSIAQSKYDGPPPLLKMFHVWPPGLSSIRTALSTPLLKTTFQRIKVLCLIAFVGVTQLVEYVRLRFGAAPRRE